MHEVLTVGHWAPRAMCRSVRKIGNIFFGNVAIVKVDSNF